MKNLVDYQYNIMFCIFLYISMICDKRYATKA